MEIEIKDAPKFRTTDINAAAALMTSGHSMLDHSRVTKKTNGRMQKQTEFIFLSKGIKESLTQFGNGNLMVDARTLLDNLKHLKSLAYMRGAR